MTIIQSINTPGQFADAFARMGRGSQFSYAALNALFDYYDEMEEAVELDPIAICCEWCEYSTYAEAASMSIDTDPSCGEDELEAKAKEYVLDHTLVLEADSGAIVVALW